MQVEKVVSLRVRAAYGRARAAGRLEAVPGAEALSAFADPWTLTLANLKPTGQGARAVYNAMASVLVWIHSGVLLPRHRRRHLREVEDLVQDSSSSRRSHAGPRFPARLPRSVFRADCEAGGARFALTWMAFSLFAHLNFQTLDVFPR